MANQPPKAALKTSQEIEDDNAGTRPQPEDGLPRVSEDDIQRAEFGPRGVPGAPDPAKMTPQRDKKTPHDIDPGHTT
jgi:hypothetical protein